MNTLQKVKKFLDEKEIEYEYKKDDIFEEIHIWTALNSYYWIRIFQTHSDYYKYRRTIITKETYDIEQYKPNGEAYQGDMTERVSFEALKYELKAYHEMWSD